MVDVGFIANSLVQDAPERYEALVNSCKEYGSALVGSHSGWWQGDVRETYREMLRQVRLYNGWASSRGLPAVQTDAHEVDAFSDVLLRYVWNNRPK